MSPLFLRLLRNSLHFQSLFEQEVGKQTRPGSAANVCGTIKNMSFAKQWLDSTAKPLGHCILNLDAQISTMDVISGQRHGNSNEGQGSMNFPSLLNDRNVVLMGMLADASDECLVLTRFFDKEAFKLEDTAQQLGCFRKR